MGADATVTLGKYVGDPDCSESGASASTAESAKVTNAICTGSAACTGAGIKLLNTTGCNTGAGDWLPLVLDTCVDMFIPEIMGAGYGKWACDDHGELVKTVYSTSACTGDAVTARSSTYSHEPSCNSDHGMNITFQHTCEEEHDSHDDDSKGFKSLSTISLLAALISIAMVTIV